MKVKSNPDLSPESKEFTISGSQAQASKTGKAHFHTDHTTQMKYILELAERYQEVEILNKTTKDGYIVSVQALLPVSFISLKSKPRSNDNLSSTVSMPSARESNKFIQSNSE